MCWCQPLLYPGPPTTCELELKARKRGGAFSQGNSVIMRFILALAILATASQVRKPKIGKFSVTSFYILIPSFLISSYPRRGSLRWRIVSGGAYLELSLVEQEELPLEMLSDLLQVK